MEYNKGFKHEFLYFFMAEHNPLYDFEKAFKHQGYETARKLGAEEDFLNVFERRWVFYMRVIPIRRERVFVGSVALEKDRAQGKTSGWRLESDRNNLTTLMDIARKIAVQHHHSLRAVYSG